MGDTLHTPFGGGRPLVWNVVRLLLFALHVLQRRLRMDSRGVEPRSKERRESPDVAVAVLKGPSASPHARARTTNQKVVISA